MEGSDHLPMVYEWEIEGCNEEKKKEKVKEIYCWGEKYCSKYREKIKNIRKGSWKELKEQIQGAIQKKKIKIKDQMERENRQFDNKCKEKRKELVEKIKKGKRGEIDRVKSVRKREKRKAVKDG